MRNLRHPAVATYTLQCERVSRLDASRMPGT